MTQANRETFDIKPEIWVTAKHDVSSGTWNGLEGIAKNLSRRLGLEARILGRDEVSETGKKLTKEIFDRMEALFGGGGFMMNEELSIGGYEVGDLSSFLSWREIGIPAIVITDKSSHCINGIRQLRDSMFEGKSFPEATYVSPKLSFLNFHGYGEAGKSWIVPHNLDKEELTTEAEKLKTRLQLGNTPLISIFVGEPEDETVSDFINRLDGIVRAHPEAKFLVSSSPRTKGESFNDIVSSLKSFVGDSSRIECFDFNTDNRADNPYKGAIVLSRNVIIVSQSHNMVSERLFTGQTAHVFYDGGGYEDSPNYGQYIENGYVVNLRETDSDELVSKTFPSVDLTDVIAEDLEQAFHQHRAEHPETHIEADIPSNLLKLEKLEREAQRQQQVSRPMKLLTGLFASLKR